MARPSVQSNSVSTGYLVILYDVRITGNLVICLDLLELVCFGLDWNLDWFVLGWFV